MRPRASASSRPCPRRRHERATDRARERTTAKTAKTSHASRHRTAPLPKTRHWCASGPVFNTPGMTLASRTRATAPAACPTARAARPMTSAPNDPDGGCRCDVVDDDVVSSLLSIDRSSLPPNSIALVAHSSPVSSSRSGRARRPPRRSARRRVAWAVAGDRGGRRARGRRRRRSSRRSSGSRRRAATPRSTGHPSSRSGRRRRFPVVARDSADERWRTQALVPRRVDPTPRALRDGAQILGAADDASHDDVDRATRAV